MSNIAIKGATTGTGTFTIESPATNTDRTLVLPDEAGTVLTSTSSIPSDNLTGSVTVDGSNNVGIGTSSPNSKLTTQTSSTSTSAFDFGVQLNNSYSSNDSIAALGFHNRADVNPTGVGGAIAFIGGGASGGSGNITFNIKDGTDISNVVDVADEKMRIDSSGDVLVGRTTLGVTVAGIKLAPNGVGYYTTGNDYCMYLNRQSSDGALQYFAQANTVEGNISVSGSTVSYNGGHLSRWSRLADDSKDTSIVKGTVMTNLDEMVVWSHDAVEAQDAVYDEDGNIITEAVEAKEAYTEENEQLNKMAVSSVEGDPNVAGVFVNWDDDDDFNDMNIAMTGDMVIRIAQGTTVQRGDLLMSAGDGTAKPQGDDIVRSKTIAKVTSTHVSHTYDDGSYLVPCVLMAC